jgi:hypothetical protein
LFSIKNSAVGAQALRPNYSGVLLNRSHIFGVGAKHSGIKSLFLTRNICRNASPLQIFVFDQSENRCKRLIVAVIFVIYLKIPVQKYPL